MSTTSLTAAASALLLALTIEAQAGNVVPIETLLPDPAVTAVHFDAYGNVTQVDFEDESSLMGDVEVTMKELQNIDLVEFYHLPIDHFQMENADMQAVFFCSNHVGTTWCWGIQDLIQRGEMIVRLTPDGEVEDVQYPDGRIVSEPNVNLAENDLESITITGHRALRMIEYRAQGSDEVQKRILRD